MGQFLELVSELEEGYLPGPETVSISARLDLPRAFIDALFTSARTRGLVKPGYGRGSKVRWSVSPAGRALIAHVAHH
jgi:hypothetical protein